MNRLSMRLVLSFVLVIVIGVVSVALFANFSASGQFRQYIARQDSVNQANLLDQLGRYYQAQQNWTGVETVFANAGPRANGNGRGAGQGQGLGGPSFVLSDPQYQVLYDGRGERVNPTLTSAEQSEALPITVDNTTVGFLLINSPGRAALTQAQQGFLNQLRLSLALGAGVAIATAIALALLLSRALSAPLTQLTQAAQAFANRNWGHRVAISSQGTQEIATVANAFNQMAQSLQQAEQTRRTMVAEIAHDLRTPITVIQGNLRAMLDGVYPLDQKEIATLYDETRLLQRLVDDLRELSLADAGQLNLVIREIDVAKLLQMASQQFAAAAEMQGVQLNLQIEDDLPLAQVDGDRLAQVLHNLMTNAIRHTPSGGSITLMAHQNASTLTLSVNDTGVGIAEADLPRVFERFYRGNLQSNEPGANPGTGLGLAIAKALIEAMQGEIGVESVQGQGSRFWIRLPIRYTEANVKSAHG